MERASQKRVLERAKEKRAGRAGLDDVTARLCTAADKLEAILGESGAQRDRTEPPPFTRAGGETAIEVEEP